jgi:hypothetical protein
VWKVQVHTSLGSIARILEVVGEVVDYINLRQIEAEIVRIYHVVQENTVSVDLGALGKNQDQMEY